MPTDKQGRAYNVRKVVLSREIKVVCSSVQTKGRTDGTEQGGHGEVVREQYTGKKDKVK